MSKIIRLTESDLERIVNKVIQESETNEQGLVGKLINKVFPKAAKPAPLQAVSKVSRQMSSFFSGILPKLPATVKMPTSSLNSVKFNVKLVDGSIGQLATTRNGQLKGEFVGIVVPLENAVTELSKAAGTPFNLKKVIEELYRSKWNVEELLNSPRYTKTMGNGVKILERNLMDINKSIGEIETVLKNAMKK